MPLGASPRKAVPDDILSESTIRQEPSNIAQRRVFFCGVVVEGSESGRRLPEDIQHLVLSLGKLLEHQHESNLLSSSLREQEGAAGRKRALTDTSALVARINELLATERSYVNRLQCLKRDYADPLRKFARSRNTAILDRYKANTLFGNIDNLLPVNEAFLADLEKLVAPNGINVMGGIGDVALRHFKELCGFEQYRQYYVKREEAQEIFQAEVSKRGSPFARFIDGIKYQHSDSKNKVGLRELLVNPVQRIPQYTLLFRTMIKCMAPEDPQRAKLIEAEEIASKIAQAETDEQTKRAAIFSALHSSIEGFPPDLFSNSRHFIDSIDVEDNVGDLPISSAASSVSSSSSVLHTTLFLFDDKILIVKRPGDKSGRGLAGLDDLEKLSTTTRMGKKKNGMTFKGLVDVTDVVATDVSGADFHVYLENPPLACGDRWSGRSFRSYSVVHPPSPVYLDPLRTEADKKSFLENLWVTQANYRTKLGQSVVLQSPDVEVDSRAGRITTARAYYNVYQRTAFLHESKKTKAVIHIDALGSADPIPFGIGGPPFVVIRLQPLAGGMCRYKVTSTDPSDPGEEEYVQMGRIPSRIILTVHQFGLFEFRTGRNTSRPTTPTARSKASIFGLDVISRNLFNSRPGSTMGDFFAGSVNSNRRSKSTASRSSAYTSTRSGTTSSATKSHRSNSAASTSATTVDSGLSAHSPKPKKLRKRSQSPAAFSDFERSPSCSPSRPSSRASSSALQSDYEDSPEMEDSIFDDSHDLDASDPDLAMQLYLARKNSRNQNDRQAIISSEAPTEATIYEDYCPPSRRTSRASRDTTSQCTVTESNARDLIARKTTRGSSEHHPKGPRSPSPLPRPKSPAQGQVRKLAKALENTTDHSNKIRTEGNVNQNPAVQTPGIPRSKRLPFNPTGNTDATPRPTQINSQSGAVEPLSIKKKSSVRTNGSLAPSPSHKRTNEKTSPGGRSRGTGSIELKSKSTYALDNAPPLSTTEFDTAVQLAAATKEDMTACNRAIKRIRLDLDSLIANNPSSHGSQDSSYEERPSSPIKALRPVTTYASPSSKYAPGRHDELRQLIALRNAGEGTPRSPGPKGLTGTPSRSSKENESKLHDFNDSLHDAEKAFSDACFSHDGLQSSVTKLLEVFKEQNTELSKAVLEVRSAKRQCELFKRLLDETTTEKEIMYEAFNEELDAMYNDVNLPDDEAWAAMTEDLRKSKAARNALTVETASLKRKISEVELERDRWGDLLRTHGLIS